jgi:hypothetical protein
VFAIDANMFAIFRRNTIAAAARKASVAIFVIALSPVRLLARVNSLQAPVLNCQVGEQLGKPRYLLIP